MNEPCPHAFDHSLISGYLDHELRQADEQRVRLHLEDCSSCRGVYDELARLREATMTTRFTEPDDSQWDERPRGGASLSAFGLGWLTAIVWLIGLSGYALWQLWQEAANLMERLLVFGGLSAFALIFVSVLIDRLKSAKDDPYKEVQK